MKIAICDDEKKIRQMLKERIRRIYPDAELEFFVTGEELLAMEEQPDILFLDIQMPGRNGMEIAKELRKEGKDCIIIFVTAIEEYVFQAFDVGAFHFLLKPFDNEKLREVLINAVAQLNDRANLSEEEGENYIMVKSDGGHVKVMAEDIIFVEVFNRKVVLHTQQNGKVGFYGKLSELEKSLGEDFFRTHRSYLIHFKYVVRYTGSSVTLTDGTTLSLAKIKFSDFVQRYLKYNKRKGKEIRCV